MLVTINVTSFLKIVTLIMLIMLITIHHMPVHQTLFLSLLNFRKTAKEFGFGWFHNNNLISNKKNEKKCLLVSSRENLEIHISSCPPRYDDSVKLLGMQISNNLNFEYHMNQLCKKAKNSMFLLELLSPWTFDAHEGFCIFTVFLPPSKMNVP